MNRMDFLSSGSAAAAPTAVPSAAAPPPQPRSWGWDVKARRPTTNAYNSWNVYCRMVKESDPYEI